MEVEEAHNARPRARKLATLLVVQGSEADLGAHASIGRRAVIGRDPGAELALCDARASKHHAAVDAIDGWGGRVRYEIRDLGSTNGTAVNGKRVAGARKLKDGDKISVAGTVLRFSIADEVDVAFQAQVEAMLSTDDLTGLRSRRRFDAALDEAVRAAKAKRRPLAMLVLDVDGLKAINDLHGHATGAFTIGEIGRLLSAVLGERGVASRFGGDEFVAFLPGLQIRQRRRRSPKSCAGAARAIDSRARRSSCGPPSASAWPSCHARPALRGRCSTRPTAHSTGPKRREKTASSVDAVFRAPGRRRRGQKRATSEVRNA